MHTTVLAPRTRLDRGRAPSFAQDSAPPQASLSQYLLGLHVSHRCLWLEEDEEEGLGGRFESLR